ncbi:MAG: Ig-like domain-containing protein [Erysipelotrichaceae bacterium]|nr:Ig-like domain-containing protein [Erysipelotrichaceae bacterium]
MMRCKKITKLLFLICLICILGFFSIGVKSLFVTVNDSLLQDMEIYVGQTYQMDNIDQNIEYTCDRNGLITIDNNGLFTGLSVGNATVRVKVKGSLLYKTFEVVVKEHPYAIDSSPQQLQVNSTLTLSAIDTETNEKVNDIQWFSSNETIATVNENGVVSGIKSGDVQISLIHNNVVESVKNIEVLDEVIKVSNIVIKSGNNIILNPNQTSRIVCQLFPSNITDNILNYAIEDESIASVDSNGMITAKKIGNTTITVTSNDLNATTQINLTVETKQISGNELTIQKLQNANIDDTTKLMIVAHPDDETLGARGIILSYPDKVNGERSNWSNDKDDIIKDLEFVINYKDWDQITTHNQEGEYGHIHHKMTHDLVTSITKNAGQLNKLYYFGKYYAKNNLPNNLESNISKEYIDKKYQAYKIYASQAKTISKFDHMTIHEHWIKAIN